VFEKVIRNYIVKFLDETNAFNANQHGFRVGRSCLSQLLTHYDNIICLLENGVNVDTVYLDFAKAFDKVDHSIVIKKLSLIGIRGKVLSWIESFLTNRTQKVMVNGFLSEPAPVISGVPQGSVLGPLLFLILIGDIDRDIAESFISSFADDTRLTRAVSGVRDASSLQTDLEKIYEWSVENNMMFNAKKFEVARYGPDEVLKSTTNYTGSDGSIIPEKEHVRDLGVTMSNDGSFKQHITNMCTSARNMCAWILRTFQSRSAELMLTMWKSLVLPILDYCSQLWSPTKVGQIQEIEDIQKSFTRKIWNVNRGDYWERLSTFKLYSLQRRRERYRVIYIWKILEGLVPNVGANRVVSRFSTRHGRLCEIPHISSNSPTKVQRLLEGSFCINGGNLFNAIPKSIRNLTNVDIATFKKKLDGFLSSIADEPQSPGYTARRRAVSNSLTHMIPACTQ
jgi:ribonuclease P/MRP protein subunit RPP40